MTHRPIEIDAGQRRRICMANKCKRQICMLPPSRRPHLARYPLYVYSLTRAEGFLPVGHATRRHRNTSLYRQTTLLFYIAANATNLSEYYGYCPLLLDRQILPKSCLYCVFRGCEAVAAIWHEPCIYPVQSMTAYETRWRASGADPPG